VGAAPGGEHAADSDVDLGLYYLPPLDVDALGSLAREIAGPGVDVTQPGAWGRAGCLFRAVLLCAHALHGRAGKWLINEKGAIASAGGLAAASTGFTARAHHVLAHLGDRPDELQAAIDLAQVLLDDVRAVCGASE
jgi:hypothetical protein